jgi:hypothetical protein
MFRLWRNGRVASLPGFDIARAEVIEAMKRTGHVVKDGPYSPITEEA